MEYIFITSNQNSDLFPDNRWDNFQVELPKELTFNNKIECSLLFFDVYPKVNLKVNIFCDILEENCFENALAPILSTISEIPFQIKYPLFVPLKLRTVKNFKISIKSAFTHLTPTESIQQANLVLAIREIQ